MVVAMTQCSTYITPSFQEETQHGAYIKHDKAASCAAAPFILVNVLQSVRAAGAK